MINETINLYTQGYNAGIIYIMNQHNLLLLVGTSVFLAICFLVYYQEYKKIKTFLLQKKQLQEYEEWKRNRKLIED